MRKTIRGCEHLWLLSGLLLSLLSQTNFDIIWHHKYKTSFFLNRGVIYAVHIALFILSKRIPCHVKHQCLAVSNPEKSRTTKTFPWGHAVAFEHSHEADQC